MATEQNTIAGNTKKHGWTKARALLAGGLVLGVGAAITLASWNDSEFAKGVFGGGKFGIEGSINGTQWDDHDKVDAAAPVTFALSPDKLSPTDKVYGEFSVRLVQGSNYKGNVAIETGEFLNSNSVVVPGLVAQHRLIAAGAACNAAQFDAGNSETTFELATTAAVQKVCFEVSATEDLKQESRATIIWKFVATSGDKI